MQMLNAEARKTTKVDGRILIRTLTSNPEEAEREQFCQLDYHLFAEYAGTSSSISATNSVLVEGRGWQSRRYASDVKAVQINTAGLSSP